MSRGIRRRRGAHTAAADAAQATLLPLAVLLQAGLSPDAAWRHLAAAGAPGAASVTAALADGADVPDAVGAAGPAWTDVAAAWRVAQAVGAPLASTLRTIADALQDAERTRSEIRVALAEPAGTAKLMSWLPLVAVGLGGALGFDTLHTLTTPAGMACAAAGVALTVVARRWSGVLVRRADPGDLVAGLGADLMAIALSAGVSLRRAEQVVAGAGISAGPEVAPVLALSDSAGAPVVELLRAAGALQRHRERTRGRLRAAGLGASLLVPMGVCTLPAFLLLGVAPMLLSVLASTPLSL